MKARAAAGTAAAAALRGLALLPPGLIAAAGAPLLPGYARIRGSAARLDTLRRRLPFPFPSTWAYYRMRLRLAALTLRQLTRESRTPIQVQGEAFYRAALDSGRPVALLGWHQGPFELLHRVPPAPESRPFCVLTAGAFAEDLEILLRRGRRQPGKTAAGPGMAGSALRSWAERGGVLAFMVDQAPGRPRDYLRLWNGAVSIPYPSRLLDWARGKGAIFIPVSVRLVSGRPLFRYHPPLDPGPEIPLASALAEVLEAALSAAPDQYNWSYPKIRLG